MMAIDMETAVNRIRERFGPHLETDREAGLREMAEALQEDLGVSKQEAEDVVSALVRANTIRWMEGRIGPDTPLVAARPFAETLGAEVPTGEPIVPMTEGYWRLSSE
jgi:hypothetical protein